MLRDLQFVRSASRARPDRRRRAAPRHDEATWSHLSVGAPPTSPRCGRRRRRRRSRGVSAGRADRRRSRGEPRPPRAPTPVPGRRAGRAGHRQPRRALRRGIRRWSLPQCAVTPPSHRPDRPPCPRGRGTGPGHLEPGSGRRHGLVERQSPTQVEEESSYVHGGLVSAAGRARSGRGRRGRHRRPARAVRPSGSPAPSGRPPGRAPQQPRARRQGCRARGPWCPER